MQLNEIQNDAGETLEYDFEVGAKYPDTVVVLGHGVTANKDREWAVTLMDTLVDAGVGCLRFSFSGNGGSEGRFEESGPSKGAGDLRAVLRALHAAGAQRLIYAGHSMGAATGVLVAGAPQPSDPPLAGLVSLAGMVDTRGFAQRKFGDQVPGASLMWDKPECPLSQAFMDDMDAVGTVLPLADKVTVPWLLIHGTEDTVVPHLESEQIAGYVPGALVSLMTGVDHVFTGVWARDMAERTLSWVRNLLGE